MTGSLAPPPPYGSEQGSILLEAGREGSRQGTPANQGVFLGHGRTSSRQVPTAVPTSPGPQRSPTEISLAQLAHIPSNEDVGEGTSRNPATASSAAGGQGFENSERWNDGLGIVTQHRPEDLAAPPPKYESPEGSIGRSRRGSDDHDDEDRDGEEEPLIRSQQREGEQQGRSNAPIPTYDAAVAAGSADSRTPVPQPPRWDE